MKALTLKAVPVAAALGLALAVGAPKDAHAYAYAYSDMLISNGSVTFLPTGSTELTDFGACAVTGCANLVTAPTTTSASQATLTGGDANADTLDAAVSIGGGSSFPVAVPTNNQFSAALNGGTNAGSYTWADSQIISVQSLGSPAVNPDGTPNLASTISTRQIAEGNSTGPLGTSGASTTSTTTFQTNFTVSGDGARVRFDLDVALDMFVEIADPSTGIEALAGGTINITILDDAGAAVFTWNVGSDPLGEADDSQAFALLGISVNTQDLASFSDSGSFYAVTEDLASGEYTLNLIAQVQERVRAVPEPGSLALFGIAMLGLFGGWRMRKGGLPA